MKVILITGLFIFFQLIGALWHEKDLARNYKETCDAKAWVYEIRCKIDETEPK